MFRATNSLFKVRLMVARGVFLLALAALGIGGAFADQKRRAHEVDRDALPHQVREALDWAARTYKEPLKGVRWSKVSELKNTDHVLYQLQGTNERGRKVAYTTVLTFLTRTVSQSAPPGATA